MLRSAVVLSFLALAVPTSLRAQGLTGQISGSVQDSSESAIAGAVVELTNTGTGWPRRLPRMDRARFSFHNSWLQRTP